MHTGHRERLRARLEAEGLEGFRPHEALELLLCYAVPRRDVNDLAHALIERFGTLEAVLGAPEEALCAQEGVGEHAARFLSRFGALAKACAALTPDDMPFADDDPAAAALARAVAGEGERAFQLCLDLDGRLSYIRRIGAGRLWGGPESLREALRDALSLKAAAVRIVVFSSGGVSEHDRESAERYERTLRAAGVRFGGVTVVRA